MPAFLPRHPAPDRFAGQLDANGDTEAGAMPARPRHCNGQLYARPTHATDCGREGGDARPGARRRPRPRFRSQVLGGGRWRHAVRAAHESASVPGTLLQLEVPVRAFGVPSSRSRRRRARAAAHGVHARRPAFGGACVCRRLRRHASRPRSAAPHRLAQPVDHGAVVRHRRRKSARPIRRPAPAISRK